MKTSLEVASTDSRWALAKLLIAALPLGLLATLVLLWWRTAGGNQLPAGLTRADYDDAERACRIRHDHDPRRIEVLALAGELAARDGRYETALACFDAVPVDDVRFGALARIRSAEVLLGLDRAAEAERVFRRFLSLAESPSVAGVPPGQVDLARNWVRYILSAELRFEDRHAFLAEVHRRGGADVYDSKLLYFPELVIWSSERARSQLERFLAQDPDNRLLHTARARYLTAAGNLDLAEQECREVLAEHPGDRTAVAGLLECLFEQARWDEFASELSAAPPWASDEPWLLTRMRAEQALHERAWEEAARHFRRVLESSPANPRAGVGLATALAALGRHDEVRELRDRSRLVAEIRVQLPLVDEQSPEASAQLAEKCRACGFDEAASTFERHAERLRGSVLASRELERQPGGEF